MPPFSDTEASSSDWPRAASLKPVPWDLYDGLMAALDSDCGTDVPRSEMRVEGQANAWECMSLHAYIFVCVTGYPLLHRLPGM